MKSVSNQQIETYSGLPLPPVASLLSATSSEEPAKLMTPGLPRVIEGRALNVLQGRPQHRRLLRPRPINAVEALDRRQLQMITGQLQDNAAGHSPVPVTVGCRKRKRTDGDGSTRRGESCSLRRVRLGGMECHSSQISQIGGMECHSSQTSQTAGQALLARQMQYENQTENADVQKERDALKAENNRLRADLRTWVGLSGKLQVENAELRHRVAVLLENQERLREELAVRDTSKDHLLRDQIIRLQKEVLRQQAEKTHLPIRDQIMRLQNKVLRQQAEKTHPPG